MKRIKQCSFHAFMALLIMMVVPIAVFAQQPPLTISPQGGALANKPVNDQTKPAASAKPKTDAKPKVDTKPKPQKQKAYPLPPIRPAELNAEAGLSRTSTQDVSKQETSKEVAPSSSPLPNRSLQSAPKTNDEAAAFLNAYFNSFAVMSGDFIQFGADGRRVEGRFELHKPGRLRFDYNPPSPLEIIADGQSVAIRDKRLNTQDLYPLSQTPLKFLLKQRIDLMKETRILKVSSSADEFRTTIEDKATLGGTSQITLFYDMKARQLTRWEVVDPQGLETSVAIYNLNMMKVPAPSRFKINQERILEDRR